MRLTSTQIIASVFFLLFVLGCSDTERLDRLESEIRAIRSDTRDEVASLRDQIEADEAKGGGGMNPGNLGQRFDHLENKFIDLLKKYDDRDELAYLRPNVNGHATMQTDHGSFLVRLEGIDLNVAARGFTVHLNIGNPLSLTVQQFLLKGDFGSGVPALSEGQDYSVYNKQIDEWQRTLKPFEYRITKPLMPMSWTPVDIVIEAGSRDELELIRFKMLIENAHLEGIEALNDSASQSFAHVSVDGESASVLKTDYGAFLILVRQAEVSGSGTRLEIEIGNPYGFTINQCRIIGDFGEVSPKRAVGESQTEFLARMQEWTAGLKPFNSPVDGKMASFRWNKASILVPGPPNEVKFLRAQLRIENVTLPQVVDDLDKVPRFKR